MEIKEGAHLFLYFKNENKKIIFFFLVFLDCPVWFCFSTDDVVVIVFYCFIFFFANGIQQQMTAHSMIAYGALKNRRFFNRLVTAEKWFFSQLDSYCCCCLVT